MEYIFKIFELACKGVPEFLVVTTLTSIIFGCISCGVGCIASGISGGCNKSNSNHCHDKKEEIKEDE